MPLLNSPTCPRPLYSVIVNSLTSSVRAQELEPISAGIHLAVRGAEDVDAQGEAPQTSQMRREPNQNQPRCTSARGTIQLMR